MIVLGFHRSDSKYLARKSNSYKATVTHETRKKDQYTETRKKDQYT